MRYDKRVRARIPEIIENQGGSAVTRVLSGEEYLLFLEAKLDAEVGEYHRDKSTEELADIYALAASIGCSKEELEAVYQKKTRCPRRFRKTHIPGFI